MEIIYKKVSELVPYINNARTHNNEQVDQICASINEYGFTNPILIDEKNSIIAGHGRLLAAKKLKMKEVPCIVLCGLTEAQKKAYIIADNKLALNAGWNDELLKIEFENLKELDFDLNLTGFSADEIEKTLNEIGSEETEEEKIERQKKEFEERMASGELSDDDEEYQEFLSKFEAKKTTDDCYTPQIVYDAIADYVAKKYDINKVNFVRPFVPRGDYQKYKYKETDIVVDNPPFSILAEIIKWYSERNIKFFLFAPYLTLFSAWGTKNVSYISANCDITYENGARVNTSFITNLEKEQCIRSSPTLYRVVKEANFQNIKKDKVELPKYLYPPEVITSTQLGAYSKYQIDFKLKKDEIYFIRQLDSQKEIGKGIFGSAFLISNSKVKEREELEGKKQKIEYEEKKKIILTLSEREKEIIRRLK